VLILGAVVANVNLAIANVALPSIGAALDTSQAELNLVAVGFTLGLASSVLYLGALADRYGRKPAMMLGAALSIPTSLLAAWAPNASVLIVARVSGGVAAGLLYPITLSLITGLFRGGARTRAIALWSGIGGGCSALGPLLGVGPPARWAAAGPLLVGVGVPAQRADRGAGGRAGRAVAAPARGGDHRAG
jgi:MFS family permease